MDIFQGDSLSPMLLAMSLIPLSWVLNYQKNGYKIDKNYINHLIYMDDLKIYGSSNKQTALFVNTSSLFLHNIGLELGPDETYKYLGVAQSTHIHKEEMGENVSNEYHRREER